MNLKTKVKGNIMADSCAKTIVAAIGNGFVKCSRTKINVNSVGFDDLLSKKSISIGAYAT